MRLPPSSQKGHSATIATTPFHRYGEEANAYLGSLGSTPPSEWLMRFETLIVHQYTVCPCLN